MINKKYLITGMSGLLGPYVADALLKKKVPGNNILGVYNSTIPIYKDVDSVKLDLIKHMNYENDFDVIIHCAAGTDVNRCETDETYAVETNVVTTKNICDFAKQNNSKIVFISSEAVYYNQAFAQEIDPTQPLTNYGKKKVEAENIVLELKDSLVLRTTIFGKNLNGGFKLFEHAFNNLGDGQPVNAICDNEFNPVTVKYFSDTLINLLDLNASGIFNISSDKAISRCELYHMIAKTFGLDGSLINPISLESISSGIPKSRICTLDNSKMKKYLNYTKVDLNEQMRDLIE